MSSQTMESFGQDWGCTYKSREQDLNLGPALPVTQSC